MNAHESQWPEEVNQCARAFAQHLQRVLQSPSPSEEGVVEKMTAPIELLAAQDADGLLRSHTPTWADYASYRITG